MGKGFDGLAAAKSGLMAKPPELERRRIELARMWRMRFGHSSEWTADAADQSELMQEAAEAAADAAEGPQSRPPAVAAPSAATSR